METTYFTQQFEGFTKYERTRLIGARALQLSMGAPMLLKLSDEDLEGLKYRVVKVAEKEFEEGVIPLSIVRPLPELKELEVKIE